MTGNRTFQRFLEIVPRPRGGRTKASGPDTLPRPRSFSTQALLADAEFLDDALVTLGIVLLQVVEQATALADKHEQAPA